MNNREKILQEALNLFSVKGFDAVNVRDIAQAVGIKASSLYNHFKSKEEIFECIVKEYSARINQYFQQGQLISEDMQFSADERTVSMYRNMTTEQFAAAAGQVFEAVFADEVHVKLRKLLTIEQYRNEKLSMLFREISFSSSIEYQTKLFDAMIKAGCFIEADPYLLAVEFYAPAFLLFYMYGHDEEGVKQARELFMRHIRHFSETYSVKPERAD